jgi:carbamate kinase
MSDARNGMRRIMKKPRPKDIISFLTVFRKIIYV